MADASLAPLLTDAQRTAISDVLEPINLGPKETICREGEPADALYLIREGRVAAYKADEGKEQGKLLGEMGQQQFFGVLLGQAHDGQPVALTARVEVGALHDVVDPDLVPIKWEIVISEALEHLELDLA